MRLGLPALFLFPFVYGCATEPNVRVTPDRAPLALRYQHDLVGKKADDILRCAGVPDKTYKDDHRTFWGYSSSQKTLQGGSFSFAGKQSFGISTISGKQVDCYATLEFSTETVSGVTYQTAASGPDELCSNIFLSCFGGAEERAAAGGSPNCPPGWSSKNNEPCYPDKPLFGGADK